MKEIRLYWFDGMPNFGDMLNVEICRRLFRVNPVQATPETCEASFIGSLLDDFLYDKKSCLNVGLLMNRCLRKPVEIWGSGFIADRDRYVKTRVGRPEMFFRRANVHAVRGKLSASRLERILGTSMERVVVADPGLLAGRLLASEGGRAKKYRIGIIPHHLEIHGYKRRRTDYACPKGLLPADLALDVECYEKVRRNLEAAVFIDMEADVTDCLARIAECELIASSSLHGLIVADSLHIPNVRILASDRLIGGDYKFNDYYSAYSCSRQVTFDLTSASDGEVGKLPEIVEARYVPVEKEVETLKGRLIEAFPYKETP